MIGRPARPTRTVTMRLSPASSASLAPRRARAVVGSLVVATTLVVAGACASTDQTADTTDTSAAVATVVDTTAPPQTEAPTTTVDVGTLEQTDEEPTETGALWDEHVDLLWEAIVTDDPEKALPFFFPEGAYLQVKRMTESEATADYANRLIAYYEQDIHALHQQLGSDAASAELVELSVPPTATWIQPGVEYNKGSYWRVLDSSLVYEVGGVQRTFPVASMISWRGEWYIVHLSSIR